MQDTTAKLGTDGRDFSFMAFWSTSYNAKEGGGTYDTCVLIAGVEIDVAETVAEWMVEERPVRVGNTPCHCGFFSCETCPAIEHEITRTPIFKRRVLSLKQQRELHHWLVSHAVESAESLVGALDDGKGSFLSLSGWTDPNKAYNRQERVESGAATVALPQPRQPENRVGRTGFH